MMRDVQTFSREAEPESGSQGHKLYSLKISVHLMCKVRNSESDITIECADPEQVI